MHTPRLAIAAINDFVVKFANVNGSGSASANELFARSILRMGVPVSPRNIFPSNIQGLPTWYEVRVTEQGWLGRRGGVDMMVAMNPQTWAQDLKEIDSGGYLLYDSTRPVAKSDLRTDITVIGVPLTAICNDTYSDVRQRQLFKNIICLGVLSWLFEIDPKEIERLFGEQYKGKEALLASNVRALDLGRDYARDNIDPATCQLKVRRADAVGDRIFVEGNNATALGCVYGGATVCAWYPITPSTSVAEAFQSYCRKLRHDPETGANALRHRAGRGRARLHRHGHRRSLERRPRLHRHVGTRHFADDRVHRPGLFRRDTGRDHRRAARRPVDRHADPHPAGRPDLLRLRLQRRHQARAPLPRGPEGVLRLRRRRARPRRPPADARLRHVRPRHRHELPAVQAVRMGRGPHASTAAR